MADIQKSLDYAIRDHEIGDDSSKYGYKIRNQEPYENYMSNDEWNKFKNNISKLHQAQFNDGDGGELKEKKGRYGIYPPKMASYGSSSRMIYVVSKDIDGFEFEKQLPTRIGPLPANLDGYLWGTNRDIYVEAKCREIYASHQKVQISNVYKDVYDFIRNKYYSFSYYDNYPCKDEGFFKCTFIIKDTDVIHFDIKQLICHFLGITANMLQNNYYKPIRFIYLIFNPEPIKDYLANEKREAIINTYKETLKEIRRWDFGQLFEAVLAFQEENLGLSRKKDPEFEFVIVDQNEYKEQFYK